MTVEAIRVCGAIAALIDGAALPTANRLAAQEIVDTFLKAAMAGEGEDKLEDLVDAVETLTSEISEMSSRLEDLQDSAARIARQLDKLSNGDAA